MTKDTIEWLALIVFWMLWAVAWTLDCIARRRKA